MDQDWAECWGSNSIDFSRLVIAEFGSPSPEAKTWVARILPFAFHANALEGLDRKTRSTNVSASPKRLKLLAYPRVPPTQSRTFDQSASADELPPRPLLADRSSKGNRA